MQTVNREEFLQTLSRVAPGLSTKDFIEQSSCFVFEDGWVSTFNTEICCRTETGLDPEICGAVRAAPLLKVLEIITDDVVKLDVTDKVLRVIGNRKSVDIRREAKIVLPVDQVPAPESWKKLPEDFTQAIEKVMGSSGSNKEEFITICVHLSPDFVEATDRKQITRYKLDTGFTRSYLVRTASIKHLVGLGVVKMGETPEWIHFRNKSLVFSIRCHLESFPNVTGMLESFTGEEVTLPRGADEASKLGAVFADETDGGKLQVKIADGHMYVTGEGLFGRATADLETTHRGKDFAFRISPQMLTQLVKDYTSCELGEGKLRVCGEKWIFLTVLSLESDSKTEEPEPLEEEVHEEETEPQEVEV